MWKKMHVWFRLVLVCILACMATVQQPIVVQAVNDNFVSVTVISNQTSCTLYKHRWEARVDFNSDPPIMIIDIEVECLVPLGNKIKQTFEVQGDVNGPATFTGEGIILDTDSFIEFPFDLQRFIRAMVPDGAYTLGNPEPYETPFLIEANLERISTPSDNSTLFTLHHPDFAQELHVDNNMDGVLVTKFLQDEYQSDPFVLEWFLQLESVHHCVGNSSNCPGNNFELDQTVNDVPVGHHQRSGPVLIHTDPDNLITISSSQVIIYYIEIDPANIGQGN